MFIGEWMMEKTLGVDALSARQKEVLRLVAAHHQAKEIARLLHISQYTVKTHIEEARRRLGSPSGREAARQLMAHEGVPALLPEVGAPSGVMPKPVTDVSSSNDEHTLFPERTIPHDPLVGSGDRLAHAGLASESRQDRGHLEGPAYRQPDAGIGKGGFLDGGGVSLADGRRSGLRRRLKALSGLQWAGLTLLVGILLPLLAGVLIQSAHATFEAFKALAR